MNPDPCPETPMSRPAWECRMPAFFTWGSLFPLNKLLLLLLFRWSLAGRADDVWVRKGAHEGRFLHMSARRMEQILRIIMAVAVSIAPRTSGPYFRGGVLGPTPPSRLLRA